MEERKENVWTVFGETNQKKDDLIKFETAQTKITEMQEKCVRLRKIIQSKFWITSVIIIVIVMAIHIISAGICHFSPKQHILFCNRNESYF